MTTEHHKSAYYVWFFCCFFVKEANVDFFGMWCQEEFDLSFDKGGGTPTKRWQTR